MNRLAAVLVAAFLGISVTPALADPCKAPLPRSGTTFIGTVRYIGDGDSLCLGPSRDPASWIEVRLADFNAPELHERGGVKAKRLLEAVAMGQPLVCQADHRSYDRIVAHCTLNGRGIGMILHEKGGIEGGR